MNKKMNKNSQKCASTVYAYFDESSHILALHFFKKVLHKKNFKIITIFEDGKEIQKESYNRVYTLEYEKSETLQLDPITPKLLFTIRCSNEAGLVLKQNNALYYTKLDNENGFVDFRCVLLNRQHHLCSSCQRILSDKNCMRRCLKVWDQSLEHYNGKTLTFLKSQNFDDFKQLLKSSKRIEKYPFLSGFETFNLPSISALIVTECENYKH